MVTQSPAVYIMMLLSSMAEYAEYFFPTLPRVQLPMILVSVVHANLYPTLNDSQEGQR